MLDAQETQPDRYVAAWNEPDAASRLRAVAALWAPGAMPGQERANQAGIGGLGRLVLGSSRQNGGRVGVRFRAARTARGAATW